MALSKSTMWCGLGAGLLLAGVGLILSLSGHIGSGVEAQGQENYRMIGGLDRRVTAVETQLPAILRGLDKNDADHKDLKADSKEIKTSVDKFGEKLSELTGWLRARDAYALQNDKGPAGPAGPVGPAGVQGPQGVQGTASVRGEQGIQGIQGVQGETGK